MKTDTAELSVNTLLGLKYCQNGVCRCCYCCSLLLHTVCIDEAFTCVISLLLHQSTLIQSTWVTGLQITSKLANYVMHGYSEIKAVVNQLEVTRQSEYVLCIAVGVLCYHVLLQFVSHLQE